MAIARGCIQTCPSGSVRMPKGDPSAPENAPVEPGTKMQDHAWSILPYAAPAQLSILGRWAATPALTPQTGAPCPHPTDPSKNKPGNDN